MPSQATVGGMEDAAYAIRPLTVAEAAAVAALVRAAFAAQPVAVDPPPSALRETADGVAIALAAGGGAGAWTADGLVGAVLWRDEADAVYLHRLSVAPAWRGRGIGRALIGAVEAAARARGVARLWLSTRLALTGNRRLFAACGFVETERHAHPGYAAPTFVDMVRRLDPLSA
jgi:GNAT superfamily N-acetyltransferase